MTLNESPELKTLKKNKIDEEREQAMKAGCVWHYAGRVCAIWKSIVNGKTWYGSNTHRCYQCHPTLKAAINSFHKVVEPSA